MLELKIKYHVYDIPRLRSREGSDWIDMYAAEDVEMSQFSFDLISLGISVQIPDGYEMHIAPRSSTFKRWGILLTNSVGVIDNSYNGDGDIIKFPALAMRDTFIEKGDKICQFRLVKNQEPIEFKEVSTLGNDDRGGIGSTGRK